jgi:hypothetical protein
MNIYIENCKPAVLYFIVAILFTIYSLYKKYSSDDKNKNYNKYFMHMFLILLCTFIIFLGCKQNIFIAWGIALLMVFGITANRFLK